MVTRDQNHSRIKKGRRKIYLDISFAWPCLNTKTHRQANRGNQKGCRKIYFDISFAWSCLSAYINKHTSKPWAYMNAYTSKPCYIPRKYHWQRDGNHFRRTALNYRNLSPPHQNYQRGSGMWKGEGTGSEESKGLFICVCLQLQLGSHPCKISPPAHTLNAHARTHAHRCTHTVPDGKNLLYIGTWSRHFALFQAPVNRYCWW